MPWPGSDSQEMGPGNGSGSARAQQRDMPWGNTRYRIQQPCCLGSSSSSASGPRMWNELVRPTNTVAGAGTDRTVVWCKTQAIGLPITITTDTLAGLAEVLYL